MQLVKFRNPGAELRGYAGGPLMVSVEPLLVPGRSKNARTSDARCFSNLPTRQILVSALGTPLAACIISFSFCVSGSRYAATIH